MPLQPIETRRLYRHIADQVAGLIARGEFPPGSRLPTERELFLQGRLTGRTGGAAEVARQDFRGSYGYVMD